MNCIHLLGLSLLTCVLWLAPASPAWGQTSPEADEAAPAPETQEEQTVHPALEAVGATFQQTPWSAWLVLLAAIFLGLLAGKLLSVALQRAAARFEARQKVVRSLVFADAAHPASLALLTVGLSFGVGGLVLADDVRRLAEQMLLFLYLLALGWFLYNLVNIVDVGLRLASGRVAGGRMDEMVVTLVRRALRIFLVVIFTLFVADTVFQVNIAAWLAGFGLAGLAISLAAQDSVRNLFGSLTVFLDKPFAVGDMINFNGQIGTVTEIGFRSTKQRLFTGAVVTIPNMKFIDGSVENISRRQSIRRTMNISLTYDTPPEKIEQAVQIVRDLLHEEAIAEPFNMEQTPPRVYFNEYAADYLNLMAIYWYILDAERGQDWWSYNDHAQQVNLELFRRFREAGIDFAFPTRTLYLAGDPDRELAVRLLPESPGQADSETSSAS